ncbi:uncharacterized protein LOC111120909 isoform X2 [Crassostrea virginica]
MNFTTMSTKKEVRIEAKKRKAAAFLRLEEESTPDKVKKLEESQAKGKAESSAGNNNEKRNNFQQMAEDELLKLRQALKERQKASMERPKIFLTLEELARENTANFRTDLKDEDMPPLFISDIQSLILFAVQGSACKVKPRWCKLLRCTKVASIVVMVLNGVSNTEMQKYPDSFPTLRNQFQTHVDIVNPSQYAKTVPSELFCILPPSHQRILARETVENKAQTEAVKEDTKISAEISTEKCLTEANPLHPALYQEDVFSRTLLLLSTAQLMQEKYPLPVQYSNVNTMDFKFTKDNYSPVDERSPMFGLDCEMCLTVARRLELTRISIVNEKLEVLYDTFVKPHNRIINYLTEFSGITKAILDPVTTRLSDVQKKIRELLPANAIICGQSLGGDLRAIKMYHPYVIDTSCIYNLSGRSGMKTGLKRLTEMFVKETIQEGTKGHNSVEDAKATMKLVQHKLKHNVNYGDVRMGWTVANPDPEENPEGEGSGFKLIRLEETTENDSTNNSKSQLLARQNAFFKMEKYFYSMFEVLKKYNKTAALVTDQATVDRFGGENGVVAVGSDSDKKTKSLAKSHVQFLDFVYCSLDNYLSHLNGETSEEKVMHCLQKMDKRVDKILKNVKKNSLAILIVPGRTDPECENTGTVFVKIKE